MSSVTRVERVVRRASLVSVVVCLLALAVTAARFVVAGASDLDYRVGERVELPLAWFDRPAPTLLVFLRSDCPASQSVTAWLRELRDAMPASVQVLLVFDKRDPGGEVQTADHGFEPQAIRTIDLSRLKLRTVPALMLIDRTGAFLAGSVGALEPSDRTRLLAEFGANVNGM